MSTVPFVEDQSGFEELRSSSVPVLVDFTASWCGPCKALAPVLDDLASEYDADTLNIVKVDVDNLPAIAEEFGIQGVPTLVLLDEGEELARFNGGSKKELRGRIDDLL